MHYQPNHSKKRDGNETVKVKLQILQGVLFAVGCLFGYADLWFLRFCAGMYAITGHGDDTPIRVVAIGCDQPCLCIPIAFGLAFIAHDRAADIGGLILLGVFFFRVWIGNALGLLHYFNASFSVIFELVFYAHLVFFGMLAGYFTLCLSGRWSPFSKLKDKQNSGLPSDQGGLP